MKTKGLMCIEMLEIKLLAKWIEEITMEREVISSGINLKEVLLDLKCLITCKFLIDLR